MVQTKYMGDTLEQMQEQARQMMHLINKVLEEHFSISMTISIKQCGFRAAGRDGYPK